MKWGTLDWKSIPDVSDGNTREILAQLTVKTRNYFQSLMQVRWDQHLFKSLSDQTDCTCIRSFCQWTGLSRCQLMIMVKQINWSLCSQHARVWMYLFVSAGWSVTGLDFLRCWSSKKRSRMVDLSVVQMFVCLYVQLGESVVLTSRFVSVTSSWCQFYVHCVLFMGSQICLENK